MGLAHFGAKIVQYLCPYIRVDLLTHCGLRILAPGKQAYVREHLIFKNESRDDERLIEYNVWTQILYDLAPKSASPKLHPFFRDTFSKIGYKSRKMAPFEPRKKL